MPRLRNRWLLAVIAAVATSVLFLDFCDLIYACGCRSMWGGADAMCNIHQTGVKHCPLCAVGFSGSVIVWLLIVGVQSFLAMRLRTGAAVRALLTFAAFPVVGSVIAVGLGWSQGYWR